MKEKTAKEILEAWSKYDDVDQVMIIAVPKTGGWRWQTNLPTFEFLAGVEGVVQKLKLNEFRLPDSMAPAAPAPAKKAPPPPRK